MITIKAEVLKGKQKSDGTYNVKIRMTYKREVKRLPTSIYVRKEDLTKAFKIKNPKFIKEANNIVRQYQELCASLPLETANYIWGIERSGFFNGREKWAKGFENQRV